jgi:hypothetical protein
MMNTSIKRNQYARSASIELAVVLVIPLIETYCRLAHLLRDIEILDPAHKSSGLLLLAVHYLVIGFCWIASDSPPNVERRN